MGAGVEPRSTDFVSNSCFLGIVLCLELQDSLKAFLFPNVALLRYPKLTPELWTPILEVPGAASGHACCAGLQSTLVWVILCLSSVPKFKTILKEEGKKVFS